MGACVCKAHGYLTTAARFRSSSEKKQNNHRRRRRVIERRVLSRKKKPDMVDPSSQTDRSRGCFDSTFVPESELDEEFHSVHEDVSLHESEIGEKKSIDEGSSVLDESGGEDGTAALHHRGILVNTCLPCLVPNSVVPSVDKRRPLSPGGTHSRRKSTTKYSAKLMEGHSNRTLTCESNDLVSPKALHQRPIAGSTVPFCPIETKMPNCWSPIEPRTFKLRGQNYLKNKKKDCAPNCAAFYPFGVDVFLSQRKIDHIARFVEFPGDIIAGEVPSILVVNLQIPLYPATIFQSDYDGEGINMVLYFRISENFSKELPRNFQENINRLINDEVERVKSFPLDTIASFRERLKIVCRLSNLEDIFQSATEKKLTNAYNEKPILSRPQHEFYLGENYLEIDLNVHKFSYIARKGFETFHDRIKHCILDFGLTIQGNKAEDLPEHMLCCVRLNKIDYNNYKQLVL